MRAFRFTAPHTTVLRTIPQPDPAPGEVLVRVGAAGACHSDLHIIDAIDVLCPSGRLGAAIQFITLAAHGVACRG